MVQSWPPGLHAARRLAAPVGRAAPSTTPPFLFCSLPSSLPPLLSLSLSFSSRPLSPSLSLSLSLSPPQPPLQQGNHSTPAAAGLTQPRTLVRVIIAAIPIRTAARFPRPPRFAESMCASSSESSSESSSDLFPCEQPPGPSGRPVSPGRCASHRLSRFPSHFPSHHLPSGIPSR